MTDPLVSEAMKYRVLLVDDHAQVLRTLQQVFQARQYAVLTASSAAEAVEQMARNEFDLIVTDMRMETPTAGFDVVRSAKTQPYKPVVVILSAFPIPTNEWRNSGADALFVKGGGIFRIIDDIEKLLRGRSMRPDNQPRAIRDDRRG